MSTARPPVRQRRAWTIPAWLAAGVAADAAFDPVHRHVPLCPLRALTGWDCPFCGGLRAVDDLAHGHLIVALHANAVLVLAAPLLAWLWFDSLQRAGRPRRALPRWTVPGTMLLLATFAVVRNLPAMAALRPN